MRGGRTIAVLAVLLTGTVIVSFVLGVTGYPPGLVARVLVEHLGGPASGAAEIDDTTIWLIRMPRIVAAVVVGAALAAAGTAYQALFRNPMVSPDLLGASGGAGVGAATGILLAWSAPAVQVAAFACGLAAVAATYTVGRAVGRGADSTLTLVLTGIVVSSLCSALISLAKYLADPDDALPQITFWLLGGLDSVTLRGNLLPILAPVALGLLPLVVLRWQLTVLSTGDDDAATLGVDTRLVTGLVIVGATLMTAAAVSAAGVIGWVGLVVPHAARLLVGPDLRRALPVAALLGALFLLVVDNVVRVLLPAEVPIGILTALIGAPFFLVLLARRGRAWR
ncbi:iron complex transport system permease protein [Pseudonocardia autotrophica]|uniref:Iron ABC transporter permease n=1 Tax=Pseudonocardia saturnea TaxID=33909 RepID=A0ABQ0S2P6_9PSEU|nr:iron complex transport system permease protein [Pseudonocardia autotrophica]BBF99726.1 iron ABC transporter permease [Pseudonocardia autotrophica]GEC27183.1 iron ABC transporter permease [Pseudonocardia saturnea]